MSLKCRCFPRCQRSFQPLFGHRLFLLEKMRLFKTVFISPLLWMTMWNALIVVSGKKHHEHLETLQEALFENYSRNILPQQNKTDPIEVRLDIALNQIIDLDERLQTITTILWVRLYWRDFRLTWNSTDYGGVKSFVTSSRKVWLPDITLYNNANDNYDKQREGYYGLTIYNDGQIGWFYPTIFKSSCTIDVSYFPFDDQKCTLKFGSWSYHGLSLDIFNNGAGDTDSFTDNGEFILLSMPATKYVTKYRCCPEPYPFITYDVNIRRRTMYYILNFLTPCVLMSALTILSFCLPVESGERMNVGVTVLLSLTVIMLLLAESLPATSETVPLISRFYTLTMINVFISIVFTCVVLTFHHHAPTPLPPWVHLVIVKWCANLFRVKKVCSAHQRLREFIHGRAMKQRNSLELDQLCSEGSTEAARDPNNVCLKENGNAASYKLKLISPKVSRRASPAPKPPEALEVLVEKNRSEDEKQRLRDEWQFAAQVLNRVFMCIVFLLVFFNCLSILVSAHRTDG